MLYIIANLLSGGGKGKKVLAQTEEYFKNLGVAYKLLISTYATESVKHGKNCAEEAECTKVAVIGGDGTFNEVINGFGSCSKPIGFIAAGTGNDFIRTMNIPKDPAEAAAVINSGSTVATDVISFNGRRCLNILGTGLDVELLQRANRYRKTFRSSLSYYISLIVTLLTFKNRNYTFSVDGGEKQTVCGIMASVANGKYCGGGLPVAPDSITNDGKIDFILIRKVNRLKLPYLFAKFLKGKLLTLKCVEFFRCSSLTLEVNPSLPFNCDGELISCDGLSVNIEEKAINVLCPQKNTVPKEVFN